MTPQDFLPTRQHVWLNAWIAVAAASNCRDKEVPAKWADKCLEAFDQRFKERATKEPPEGRPMWTPD